MTYLWLVFFGYWWWYRIFEIGIVLALQASLRSTRTGCARRNYITLWDESCNAATLINHNIFWFPAGKKKHLTRCPKYGNFTSFMTVACMPLFISSTVTPADIFCMIISSIQSDRLSISKLVRRFWRMDFVILLCFKRPSYNGLRLAIM